jgi:amino acid transporter
MSTEEGHRLGFWSIVLLGINGIIGSGIFLLPGKVMNLVGHWSLAVYLLVSLIVLAVAWCFAQCAALFNRNGGAYIYAKEAFGDFIGFEIGIMRWAVGIMSWAAVVVGFITALSSIWPAALQEPMRSLLILGLVGGLGLLNITGMTIFKHINNVVTVAKLALLLSFVLVGLFFIQKENFSLSNWQEWETETFGSAALIIFYAFGGFETLVVAAGEMRNPRQNLPLAVMLVIICCSSLYFLIQMIAIGLLGESLGESVAPLADAAQLWLGDLGKWFATLAMLISIGGINLSSSFITPRSGVALAEDGLISKRFADMGRFGTPVWAILLTISLTGLLALSGGFTQLVVMSVISRFAQYISTCLAVYVLHKKERQSPSVLKRLLFTFVPAFALGGIAWLLWQATLSQLILGLGALVCGIPFYVLQHKEKALAKQILP